MSPRPGWVGEQHSELCYQLPAVTSLCTVQIMMLQLMLLQGPGGGAAFSFPPSVSRHHPFPPHLPRSPSAAGCTARFVSCLSRFFCQRLSCSRASDHEKHINPAGGSYPWRPSRRHAAFITLPTHPPSAPGALCNSGCARGQGVHQVTCSVEVYLAHRTSTTAPGH